MATDPISRDLQAIDRTLKDISSSLKKLVHFAEAEKRQANFNMYVGESKEVPDGKPPGN